MKLHLELGSCVRATSKFSTCTQCVDVAPESITLVEGLPTFNNGLGVEAAVCVGACPTEAFSLSDFSTTEFFFSFLDSKVRLISSKLNVPCLSVLSVEHLIALALASEEPITLDLSAYEGESRLYTLLSERIEEANFVLASLGDKRLETNSDETLEVRSKEEREMHEVSREDTIPTRRDFLNQASLKGVLKHKMSFDEMVERDEFKRFELDKETIAKIRAKRLPDKKKIFLTTLKHSDAPEHLDVLAEEDVTFTSQKFVEESCTNCQICYRICPTGALGTDTKFSKITFDAMLCVKCHLCHDVCEPDAIKLQPGFELKEFFEPKQRLLATFNVQRCDSCGNHFTYKGGERICPRCLTEEEEARELQTLARANRAKLDEK
jgi:energy-converting hydrogenase A subunit P